MSLAAQFATNTEVLALADEIAGGTINKVMAKSDLDLGMKPSTATGRSDGQYRRAAHQRTGGRPA
jgi:hypothetical protein